MSDLRKLERESIYDFVRRAGEDGYLRGRVLDYGCGKAPYRSLVESFGADWYGYDRGLFPANVSGADIGSSYHFGAHRYADTILCTQVVQYVPLPELLGDDEQIGLIERFQDLLGWPRRKKRGCLILTYPTHWPEVEDEDLHRFTKAGMEHLLTAEGFKIERHERRHELVNSDGTWAIGYGVIARA